MIPLTVIGDNGTVTSTPMNKTFNNGMNMKKLSIDIHFTSHFEVERSFNNC